MRSPGRPTRAASDDGTVALVRIAVRFDHTPVCIVGPTLLGTRDADGAPQALPAPINDGSANSDPTLSPDGRSLLRGRKAAVGPSS